MFTSLQIRHRQVQQAHTHNTYTDAPVRMRLVYSIYKVDSVGDKLWVTSSDVQH